ncbi:MAG: hypothetical protein KatS3mg031_0712 [Chitinophagales bacterium]|nr:MAG: hypothetical protein KatS3mg031_0712 [Chitinophagales bacterium]
MSTSKYSARGVSAQKEDVHQAIRDSDRGIFPGAFCRILPDYAGGDPAYCNILHADTAGTKSVLAYLYWKETGDLSVWKGIVQDALVMNTDDMVCCGAIGKIVVSSTIGRNKLLIPGEVVKHLIQAVNELAGKWASWGMEIYPAGGETADIGDVIRTVDVGFTAFTRMLREKVLQIQIRPGDVIVGLASSGQTSYEEEYNSGIGCNGLTSARHDVLSHVYAENYPETYDPQISPSLVYCGSRKLTDIDPVYRHFCG